MYNGIWNCKITRTHNQSPYPLYNVIWATPGNPRSKQLQVTMTVYSPQYRKKRKWKKNKGNSRTGIKQHPKSHSNVSWNQKPLPSAKNYMNRRKMKRRRKAQTDLKPIKYLVTSHVGGHSSDGGENAITLVSQLPETQMLQNKLSSWVLTDVLRIAYFLMLVLRQQWHYLTRNGITPTLSVLQGRSQMKHVIRKGDNFHSSILENKQIFSCAHTITYKRKPRHKYTICKKGKRVKKL
jgi:hypothetical protein